MIGVTIGIGRLYEKSARLAADCLKAQTGLDSVILDAGHWERSGLAHPAALKLRVLDLTAHDEVLYFDADWFCVGAWSPTQFVGHRNIVACHDFVMETDWPRQEHDLMSEAFAGDPRRRFVVGYPGEPRRDYIDEVKSFTGMSMHYSLWPNTGFFMVSRRYHRRWLEHAERIYSADGGHHPDYYEQPAMVRALEQLDLAVDFLPRRFNVLVCRPGRWPRCSIGLHLKLGLQEQFCEIRPAILEGSLSPAGLRTALLEVSPTDGRVFGSSRSWS